MSTPAANNNACNTQEVVWICERKFQQNSSTASLAYLFHDEDNPFFHSIQFDRSNIFSGTATNFIISKHDKKFINFKNSFKAQFLKLSDYYRAIDFNMADTKMSLSLNSLLELNPDIITMELTTEQSIFYTIKKDDYTFFVEHFLSEMDYDEDEVILTGFKGDRKLPSFGGTLKEALYELSLELINDFTNPVSILKFQFEEHELSK